MPSLFASLTDRDPAAAAPSEREIVPGRFAAAAEAGQTIALVMAKDPDAAVVYYFREAARALSTYERLARMGSTPAVAYISPAGAVLGPAQLALTPTLGRCAASWFAAALREDPPPLRRVAPAL